MTGAPRSLSQTASSAAPTVGKGKIEVKRTVCSHCSVGCAVDAVVENGVWVRQEPVFDSINDRVYGMEKMREDVSAKWTPDKAHTRLPVLL